MTQGLCGGVLAPSRCSYVALATRLLMMVAPWTPPKALE